MFTITNINFQSKPPDFVDGPRAHGSIAVPHAAKANNRARPTTGNSVRQWTNEDVKTWMDTNQLPRYDLSRLVGKPTMWFPTRFDTNRAVQAQKMARDWTFWIKRVEELY